MDMKEKSNNKLTVANFHHYTMIYKACPINLRQCPEGMLDKVKKSTICDIKINNIDDKFGISIELEFDFYKRMIQFILTCKRSNAITQKIFKRMFGIEVIAAVDDQFSKPFYSNRI